VLRAQVHNASAARAARVLILGLILSHATIVTHMLRPRQGIDRTVKNGLSFVSDYRRVGSGPKSSVDRHG
jgi:hypothetical protein